MTALKIKKAFCVLLCFAALTVAMLFVMCPEQVSAKTNAQIQSEIDALNAKLDNINDEQSSLKSMISTATADANNLSAEITNLNYEIDLIDEQVFVIESLIEQFNTLTAQQEVQIVNLEADIDKQQKMLDDMIRMSYEYGGVGNSVEFIFSAEDFSDLISRVDLLSYHLSYNNNILDNYNTALEDLEKTKTEYEAAKLNMDEYKSQQETLRVQLEEKQAEAEIKRAQVYESKEAYEKELAEKIGVAPNTFHGYESGKHDPKSNILADIANVCGVSVDFLLGLQKGNAPAPSEDDTEALTVDEVVNAFVKAGIVPPGHLPLLHQLAELALGEDRVVDAQTGKLNLPGAAGQVAVLYHPVVKGPVVLKLQ